MTSFIPFKLTIADNVSNIHGWNTCFHNFFLVLSEFCWISINCSVKKKFFFFFSVLGQEYYAQAAATATAVILFGSEQSLPMLELSLWLSWEIFPILVCSMWVTWTSWIALQNNTLILWQLVYFLFNLEETWLFDVT